MIDGSFSETRTNHAPRRNLKSREKCHGKADRFSARAHATPSPTLTITFPTVLGRTRPSLGSVLFLMEKEMTTEVGKIGLYLVNGVAGDDAAGAPKLHFSLLVNAVTGDITGHAEQTQAVQPPGNKIPIGNLTGRVRSTGLGRTRRLSRCKGLP